MFDYTRSLITHTLNQIKSIAFYLSLFMQIGYIAYLIYALITNTGVVVVNILLLALSILYLIFFLYDKKNPLEKHAKKKIKRIHKFAKRTMKLYSAIVMVVICLTSKEFNPITLLTIGISVIVIAVQILLYILIYVIEKRIDLFIEALQNDLENLAQPITKTGDFFKKILGKEVKEKTPTKHFEFLETLRETELQNKKEKKAEKRAKFFSKFKTKSAQAKEEIATSKSTEE